MTTSTNWPSASIDPQNVVNGSEAIFESDLSLPNQSDWSIVGHETLEGTALDVTISLFIGFFLAVIIFLSVAGNILVCIAVYTDRTLRKVGNLFIVSLAISDLFVACLVMVFAVANDLQGFWVFGEQFCDIWVAFDVMCSTASILNLCAISMDRYIHIKDPLRYGRWMTKRVIYCSIATIWLLAALISFMPVSMDLHKPQRLEQLNSPADLISNGSRPAADGSGGGAAGDDDFEFDSPESEPLARYPQCALDLTPTYAIVSSCISFYFPCIVMLAIYSRLYFYAKMHVQNIKATTRPVTLGRLEGDPEPAPPSPNSARRASPSYQVSDHKAAITLGIIMGVFLMCWMPFFCVNIVAAFCKTCIPPIVFKFLTWLGYSNSAFNPIIYSIFNLEFREAFQKILTTQCSLTFLRCCCDYDEMGNHNQHHHHNHSGNHSGQLHMDQLRLGPCHQNGNADQDGNYQNQNSRSPSRRHSSSDCSAVTDSPNNRASCKSANRQGSGQHLLIVEKVV